MEVTIEFTRQVWYNAIHLMKQVIEFSKGKKTYAIAIAIGVLAASEFLGWIDMETAVVLYGLLGAGGFAALRDAINSK